MAHRVLIEENNTTGKPARSGRRFCSWILKLFVAACVLQAVAMLTLHHRLGQIEPHWHGKLPFKKTRALLVDMEAPSTDSVAEHIRQALSEPIRIATMAGIFYSGNVLGMVPNCTFRDTGEELRCAWFDGIRYEESADVADAWYYDIAAMEEPAVYRDVQSRPLPVLAVIKSEGSATRYPDLDDKLFMDQFDIEMDYRCAVQLRCAASNVTYRWCSSGLWSLQDHGPAKLAAHARREHARDAPCAQPSALHALYQCNSHQCHPTLQQLTTCSPRCTSSPLPQVPPLPAGCAPTCAPMPPLSSFCACISCSPHPPHPSKRRWMASPSWPTTAACWAALLIWCRPSWTLRR